MACTWCHLATRYYMNRCSPRYLAQCGITRLQKLDKLCLRAGLVEELPCRNPRNKLCITLMALCMTAVSPLLTHVCIGETGNYKVVLICMYWGNNELWIILIALYKTAVPPLLAYLVPICIYWGNRALCIIFMALCKTAVHTMERQVGL